MTNQIEIRVVATNATGAGLEEATASAEAAGAQAGESFSTAFSASSAGIGAEIAGSFASGEQVIQAGIDNFSSMSSQALDEWAAAVDASATSASDAYISVYEAVQAQLEATTALTQDQEMALEALYQSARAEMDALMTEAIAFNESMSTMGSGFAPMQGIDLVEQNIGTMGRSMKTASGEAESVGTAVEKAGVSAEKSAGNFGGMAAMLGGPVMYAAFGLMAVVPMLSGAFDTASYSASNYTQAVSQDTNVAGANTAATIQQTLAKTGLNDISQALGVSQATLIEYASGDANAQQKVIQAYTAKQDALNKATNAEGVHSKAQLDSGNAADKESNALSNQKSALDAVTTAVQQAILQDKANSDALLQAEMNYKILGATLDGLHSKMQLNAQQTAITSVANLNLGNSQMGLNTQLIQSEQDYIEAQSGASSYQSVLTSLNGTMLTTDQAQNTFAQDMLNAKTSFAQNKDSLDLNTQAGINNRTALVNASQAIIAMGVAQYQSSGDINSANKTIQDQINAYVKATGATGQAKDAIYQYLEGITKIPPNVSTTVTANISPAENGLQYLLRTINSSSATVTVYENSSGQVFSSGGGNKAQAVGGPSSGFAASGGVRYANTIMNEQGAEAVNLPNGSLVVPHSSTEVLMDRMMGGLGGGGGKLQVEWVGGRIGDSFSNAIFEMLRSNIRYKFGADPNSVQKALGY